MRKSGKHCFHPCEDKLYFFEVANCDLKDETKIMASCCSFHRNVVNLCIIPPKAKKMRADKLEVTNRDLQDRSKVTICDLKDEVDITDCDFKENNSLRCQSGTIKRLK